MPFKSRIENSRLIRKVDKQWAKLRRKGGPSTASGPATATSSSPDGPSAFVPLPEDPRVYEYDGGGSDAPSPAKFGYSDGPVAAPIPIGGRRRALSSMSTHEAPFGRGDIQSPLNHNGILDRMFGTSVESTAGGPSIDGRILARSSTMERPKSPLKDKVRAAFHRQAVIPYTPLNLVEAQQYLSTRILGPADVLEIASYFSDWRSAFDVLLDALKDAYDNYFAALDRQATRDHLGRDILVQQVANLTKSALFTLGFGPITALVAGWVDSWTDNATAQYMARWATPAELSYLTGSIVDKLALTLGAKLNARKRRLEPNISLREYKIVVLNALSEIQSACVGTIRGLLDDYSNRDAAQQVLMAVHNAHAETSPGAPPLVNDQLVAGVAEYCAALHEDVTSKIRELFFCPTQLTLSRRDEMTRVLEQALWAEYVNKMERSANGQLKHYLGTECLKRLAALGVIEHRGYTNWLGLDLTGYDAQQRAKEQAAGADHIFVGRYKVGSPGHAAICKWAAGFDMNRAFAAALGLNGNTPTALQVQTQMAAPMLAGGTR